MDILKVLSKLNIQQLNDMQMATGRALAQSDNSDLLVLSPTGSGKTLAYLLPTLAKINPAADRVQMVVVVPGRELAQQSAGVMASMGCGLRSACLYGGRPTMEEHRMLDKVKPQVVFGTPGRLNDHLDKNNFDASTVRIIVIDEFDKCLAMGFHDEMRRLMQRLPAIRQRVLLSATEADAIPDFVNLGRGTRLDFLDDEQQVPDRVSVYAVKSEEKDKLDTLERLLLSLGNTASIVFLNYRDSVERTNEFLRRKGFETSALHGGMEQKLREDAIFRFGNGSTNVLVATDLASRGLDIQHVDNIIHYHLPLGEEEYVHRVGRTARWEAEGKAFFVLAPDEEVPQYVQALVVEHTLPETLPPPPHPRMATLYIGKGKADKLSKGDIAGFLCKKGGLSISQVGRIDIRERHAYAAIDFECIQQTLQRIKGEKIKGLRTVFEPLK